MNSEEQVEQAAEAVQAPVLTFNVRYHHAHTGYYQQPSVIEINQEERTIKVNETPFFLGDNILVKFSEQGIKTLLNEEKFNYMDSRKAAARENITLEVDTYSGMVAINYIVPRIIFLSMNSHNTRNDDPYVYNEKVGYIPSVKEWGGKEYEPKPTDDFGYILESPPRMMMILLKGLAFVENLQRGIMKFRTTSFDVNGYVVQLLPEVILELTQIADRIKNNILESDPPIKEVSEEKDENFELVSNASTEISGELLGNNNVADLGE
jgi:hypothetical protein